VTEGTQTWSTVAPSPIKNRPPDLGRPEKAVPPPAVFKFDPRLTDATRDGLVDGRVEASRTIA
jgi:hypothetical protein